VVWRIPENSQVIFLIEWVLKDTVCGMADTGE